MNKTLYLQKYMLHLIIYFILLQFSKLLLDFYTTQLEKENIWNDSWEVVVTKYQNGYQWYRQLQDVHK